MSHVPPPPQRAGADGDPAASLSHAIFLLARAHRTYAARLLRDLGLHPGQELILMQLHEQDHQPQAALLESAGLDHSTLSKSLSRMEAAGLLTRTTSDADRRALIVSLTGKGKGMRRPLAQMWRELEATTAAGLTPVSRDALIRSLDSVRRGITQRDSDGAG